HRLVAPTEPLEAEQAGAEEQVRSRTEHRDRTALAHRIRLALGEVDAVAEQASGSQQVIAGIDVGIILRLGKQFAREAYLLEVFRQMRLDMQFRKFPRQRLS